MISYPDSLPHSIATTNDLRAEISCWKFRDETMAVESLVAQASFIADLRAKIDADTIALIEIARSEGGARPPLEIFLAEYGLSTTEGVALMCLAESLVRIPDRTTADRLIADKLRLGAWVLHAGKSHSFLVNASTWALLFGAKITTIEPGFTKNAKTWLRQLTSRLSEPVIQAAMRAAMKLLGHEFVFGTTIERAVANSDSAQLYSYDMLGEGARDQSTADRFFASIAHAIEIAGASGRVGAPGLPSVSIKLSALHPRYEYAQRERVLRELVPRLKALCTTAATAGVELTIDAEESDRLELSLDIFESLATDPDVAALPNLGIVVQAYGKRALPVLDWLIEVSRQSGRLIPVRLCKGAYWDAEIKHSQIHGHPDFPVYTRKAWTDLSYLVCAKKILNHPNELYGQFATHNAHSLAAIVNMAAVDSNYEFQRLHGMGSALYRAASQLFPLLRPVRTYAPVGEHTDLLAYLVRRLLENGSNSSFVNRFLDGRTSPSFLVSDPVKMATECAAIPHPEILSPRCLFGDRRENSFGVDLTSASEVGRLVRACVTSKSQRIRAAAVVFGKSGGGSAIKILNPADATDIVGDFVDRSDHDIDRAFSLAEESQSDWNNLGGVGRARIIDAFAEKLEASQDQLVALLCREAGKTMPDAVSEVREAVDFSRYYAQEARRLFDAPTLLEGPVGESNQISLHGRGVFVCISPWNFPLAIFVGQIAAALAAGNTVVAKSAEETPLVASIAIKLLHSAGLPVNACQLLTGGASTGDKLVRHPKTAGVAFTGGTNTARSINLAMAESNRPIVPLIAETGGQNAMIVDSSALLEQVVDDVIQSAFKSAGQRCSALRVLYLQTDIAESAINMIKGAMNELHIGDPSKIETDVGPVISERAAGELRAHIRKLTAQGKLLHSCGLSAECERGFYVEPSIFEIKSIKELEAEVFGPIVHVIRFKARQFHDMIAEIDSTGFGLTLGIHSRIESRVARAFQASRVGNTYVNRNMTGAVVGSQPFGGQRFSGTGPKAGGPNYVARFATEKVLTVNTVAAGGNAVLLSLSDYQ